MWMMWPLVVAGLETVESGGCEDNYDSDGGGRSDEMLEKSVAMTVDDIIIIYHVPFAIMSSRSTGPLRDGLYAAFDRPYVRPFHSCARVTHARTWCQQQYANAKSTIRLLIASRQVFDALLIAPIGVIINPAETCLLQAYHQDDSFAQGSYRADHASIQYNDKDHAGLADGTAAPEEHLPRFFAKSGFAGEDPKKIKKSGGGKGNWGNPGDEILDDQFNFSNARRRSNSTGYANNLSDFKTKFDLNEVEPVFEESLHGAGEDELTKVDSASTSGGSVDDENFAKSV
ncbi:hypothetical protein BD289DRAFT_491459 [Coniella lustricola]|uniref:STF2-like protein n=1 Tax=Coniella lustricola TaxID=2025994 RepID=A0A2T3AH83_9PEZI|nr:hypothetical protein BD289DRAFT_491459 [Coniella lustricola]